MAKDINGYQLSRAWFDFCFEHPEKISPNHTAIFFFAIEHCNRLGWKTKFGFPTQMTMDAVGIKKHQTYIKYFNEIVEWGFFKMVQKSQNQYSANIISLQVALPKNGKALDKAFINHAAKQTETTGQSTGQSNSSIDKPINNKQVNNKQINQLDNFLKINSEKNLNGQLSEIEISRTIEFSSITLQRKYLEPEIEDLWTAFCIQNEESYYPNRNKKVQHFRNWIKTQPHGTTQNLITKNGGKSAGANELANLLSTQLASLNTGQ